MRRVCLQWRSSLRRHRLKKRGIENWELAPLEAALKAGIVPVIYGDMAFDSVKGGAVLSTETLMFYLAQSPAAKAHFAGWTGGPGCGLTFRQRKQKVERITPASYKELANKIGGSHGVDVTGGMKSKVEEMLSLVEEIPNLNVQIFSGEERRNTEKALEPARRWDIDHIRVILL